MNERGLGKFFSRHGRPYLIIAAFRVGEDVFAQAGVVNKPDSCPSAALSQAKGLYRRLEAVALRWKNQFVECTSTQASERAQQSRLWQPKKFRRDGVDDLRRNFERSHRSSDRRISVFTISHFTF